jgi:hypothetical protein
MGLQVLSHGITQITSHHKFGIHQSFVHKSVQNLVDLPMDERDQPDPIAFEKAPIEIRYGSANENIHPQISQLLVAMERRIIVAVLTMPAEYGLAPLCSPGATLGLNLQPEISGLPIS